MWWSLVAVAVAQEDVAARQVLHEALVLEGLYGELDAAAQRYRLLVRNQGMDDVTRADALHLLGRTLYDLGAVDEARQALIEGRASGVCTDGCRDLLQGLVIDEEAIRSVPARWDFAETEHGFFHPLALQDQGTIGVEPLSDGTGVLVWETIGAPRRADQLVVGLERPTPPPERVALRLLSRDVDAWLVLAARDEQGHRYVADGIPLPAGQWVDHVVAPSALRPEDPGVPPLDAGRLTRLILEVTHPRGGPNVLLLDTFSLE